MLWKLSKYYNFSNNKNLLRKPVCNINMEIFRIFKINKKFDKNNHMNIYIFIVLLLSCVYAVILDLPGLDINQNYLNKTRQSLSLLTRQLKHFHTQRQNNRRLYILTKVVEHNLQILYKELEDYNNIVVGNNNTINGVENVVLGDNVDLEGSNNWILSRRAYSGNVQNVLVLRRWQIHFEYAERIIFLPDLAIRNFVNPQDWNIKKRLQDLHKRIGNTKFTQKIKQYDKKWVQMVSNKYQNTVANHKLSI